MNMYEATMKMLDKKSLLAEELVDIDTVLNLKERPWGWGHKFLYAMSIPKLMSDKIMLTSAELNYLKYICEQSKLSFYDIVVVLLLKKSELAHISSILRKEYNYASRMGWGSYLMAETWDEYLVRKSREVYRTIEQVTARERELRRAAKRIRKMYPGNYAHQDVLITEAGHRIGVPEPLIAKCCTYNK